MLVNFFKKSGKVSGIITLFVSFISMAVLMFALNYIINDIKAVQTKTANTIQSTNIKNFSDFFDKINKSAYMNVKIISNNIEKSIKEECDLEILKGELYNEQYSTLSNIITPHIENKYLNNVATDRNTVFVATSKGIICDYAYSYMCNMLHDCKKHTYRKWDNFINESYNPSLSKISIDSLINKNSDIIFCQYLKPVSTDYTIDYTKIDSSNIAKYYNKYGAEIFKDVEILVPTYITDNGDIFGQKDIDQGVRYENYKMIVVQRVNLYQQMQKLNPSLLNIKTMKELNIKYNRIMVCMYVTGLVITIVIILVLMQLCYNFNKYVIEENQKKSK